MKRLPKKITNEIRDILEGCRDGRLKHDQENYHCGTSHCIAGWKATIDYAKAKKLDAETLDIPEWGDRALDRFMKALVDCTDEGYYARKQWELTDTEAYQLFDACTTFPEQFALLAKLEAGQRVD